MSTFDNLGLTESFLKVLDEVGYASPTPIQEQSIPHLLEGRDLLGVAQTGTGKTAAFALPVLQRLSAGQKAPAKKPRALILSPTRELTAQIHTEFERLGQDTSLRYGIVIGGVGENSQIRALRQGVDVLAATPGRLLDLAANGHVDLAEISVLVLDEADRLLDMGFVRDVRRIVAQTPDSRQSLLFSATMPREVHDLAADILKDPAKVDVSPQEVTVAKIEQRVIHVSNVDKQVVLEHLLHEPAVERAIVFTRTKHGASRVAKKLVRAGIGADAIHGNKSQNARQRALQSFRDGETWVLVATDIAARGLDIEGVTHVVNFELPHEPESYVHRIGRTGRAGAAGLAWSLVDPEEVKRLKAIERLTREKVSVWKVELEEDQDENPNNDNDTEAPMPESTEPTAQDETNNSRQTDRSGQGRSRNRRRGRGQKQANGNTTSDAGEARSGRRRNNKRSTNRSGKQNRIRNSDGNTRSRHDAQVKDKDGNKALPPEPPPEDINGNIREPEPERKPDVDGNRKQSAPTEGQHARQNNQNQARRGGQSRNGQSRRRRRPRRQNGQ